MIGRGNLTDIRRGLVLLGAGSRRRRFRLIPAREHRTLSVPGVQPIRALISAAVCPLATQRGTCSSTAGVNSFCLGITSSWLISGRPLGSQSAPLDLISEIGPSSGHQSPWGVCRSGKFGKQADTWSRRPTHEISGQTLINCPVPARGCTRLPAASNLKLNDPIASTNPASGSPRRLRPVTTVTVAPVESVDW